MMEKKPDLEKLLKKYCGKYYKNNALVYKDFPKINTMAKILNRFQFGKNLRQRRGLRVLV